VERAAISAMMGRMHPPDADPPKLVERNPDGTFTKETLQRAMKALKKRMKLTRLDDESKLGHDPMSKGGKSGVVAVKPPDQYPLEVWQALEQKGRVRSDRHGLYEILEQPSNPSGS
jgi:hypothetical protein